MKGKWMPAIAILCFLGVMGIVLFLVVDLIIDVIK